jgi:TusA-related sulfurtransferase
MGLTKDTDIADTLDCVGLFCPQPLFQTKEAIEGIEVGEILEVIADDPAADGDLHAFAKRAGHEMVQFENDNGEMRFLIRRLK